VAVLPSALVHPAVGVAKKTRPGKTRINPADSRNPLQHTGDVNMTPMPRTAVAIALAILTALSSATVLAACNATVNGCPMSLQECALTLHV
jgi:hypothetical protein